MGTRITNHEPVTTRTEYLAALREIPKDSNWTHLRIGLLRAEVSGRDRNWTAMSRAENYGLQTHVVGSAKEARTKAVATLRAWVMRNIQDDASRQKKASMSLTKAEERARVLFHYQFNPDRKLVRYRGGAWARPGLKTEGPGDLPVFGSRDGHTGIAVLRSMARKGYVVLDEVNGIATLA